MTDRSPVARAMAAAVLVSLALGGCTGCSARATSGPLYDTTVSTWFYEMGPVGARFSDGFQILQVHGREAVTVESVHVHGGGQALDNVGAMIGLPGRPDDFNLNMKGFPPAAVPAKYRVPADGARLHPGDTYMLIVGYQVRDQVMDRQTGVSIDYNAGGHEYVLDIRSGLVTCPPPLGGAACQHIAEQRYGPLDK